MRLRVLLVVFLGLYLGAQAQDDNLRLYPINTPKIKLRRYFLDVPKPMHVVARQNIPFYASDKIQVNYWTQQLMTNLNFNQVSYSDNWSAGGVSALAYGILVQGKLDYLKDDKNFTSEVVLRYGRIINKGQLYRKTSDRIFWDNRFGFLIKNHWSFFGSISFESQFDAGYNYSTDSDGNQIRSIMSRFMAPGYFTESLGVEYKLGKELSVRVGALSMKQTVAVDTSLYKNNTSYFGLERGKTIKNDPVFQLVVNVDKEIAKNVIFRSRYAGIWRYKELGYISDRLDLSLITKINGLFVVSFTGVVLYDYDLNSKIQTNQALELGVVYQIP